MRALAWICVLVPIAVGLSVAIFRRLLAVPAAALTAEPTTDEERRVYRWWEVGACLPFLIVWPPLAYGWYLAQLWASSLFHHEAPDTRFLVEPTPIIWGIPAIFLGVITSIIPLEWLYRSLLGDRYVRFERYCVERGAINSNRVLMWLAVITSAGSAIFFVACVMTFSRFTESGIEIRWPLAFRGGFYDYTRVKAIEHRATVQGPDGKTIQRPHYIIEFDDGTSWDSRKGLRDPLPETDGQIAQLVSRRSNRPIVERP